MVLRRHDLPVDLASSMHRIYSERLLEQMEKRFSISSARRSLASCYARLISGNILTTILWWHEQQFSATESEMLQIIVTAIQQGVYSSMRESLTNY